MEQANKIDRLGTLVILTVPSLNGFSDKYKVNNDVRKGDANILPNENPRNHCLTPLIPPPLAPDESYARH